MTVIWVPELNKEGMNDLAYKHYLGIYIEEERTRI